MAIEQIGNTGIYQLDTTPIGDAGAMIHGNFQVVSNVIASGTGGSLTSTISLPYNVGLGWASGIATGVNDAQFFREASGIIGQRTGLGNQEFRVYNTYTSSTSNEYVAIGGSGSACYVGTKKGSGGGTARNLSLITDGTTRLGLDSSNNLNATNLVANFKNVNVTGAAGSIIVSDRTTAGNQWQLYADGGASTVLRIFYGGSDRLLLDNTTNNLHLNGGVMRMDTTSSPGSPPFSADVWLVINVGGTNYVFPGFSI